jgi:very-short-patch-repair endonuclease
MKCEICNKEVDGLKGLSCHLIKCHKFDKKEYYDKHFKKQNEGKCSFCGKEAIFFNLTKGYHKICDSKICLGKTRATGTYEFLMYKYNLSEKDAIILMNQRAIERGVKITDGLQKSFKENDKFFKEKSHQSKDFWLKKGFSEEESLNKIKIITDNIHKKTSDKRKNNPELYKESYSNQLGYWLKKGYSEIDAKIKLTERQTTFSLDICIEKYGKLKGTKIWIDRQEKWILNNKKSNFSKISQKLFWSLYEKIDQKDDIYFATLKNGLLDESGKNNEYKLKLESQVIIPDFFIKNKNKIIEFDGTYYHRNNPENKKRSKKRDEQLTKEKYKIFHVSEYDYNNQRELTIQKCIDFLNSEKIIE